MTSARVGPFLTWIRITDPLNGIYAAPAGIGWVSEANEIRQNAINIVISSVHRNEVPPSKESRVVPLPEYGALYPKALALKESTPPPGEGMAVNVDHEDTGCVSGHWAILDEAPPWAGAG